MRLINRFALLGTVSMMAMAMALPVAAHADDVSDLRAQIAALNAKLDKVENQQAQDHAAQKRVAAQAQANEKAMQTRIEVQEQQVLAQNAKAQALLQAQTPTRAEKQGVVNQEYITKGLLPGSFMIPGTNTSIYLGGFINFQGEYSPTENLGPKFSIGNLDPNSPGRRTTAGDFQFQSKVSRFIVQTSTPSDYGPITTNFALDFYGYVSGGDYNQALQNNSYSARIVYAYGTLGPVTLGMLNSNFIDDPDTPETFDNGGPAGVPAERTEQMRYTFKLNKKAVFAIAAENPQAGYQDTRDNIEVPSKTEPMPDFSARYEYNSDLVHFQLSGVLRDLAYNDGVGTRTSKISGAGIMGATLNLGPLVAAFGKDNVGGQIWTGAIGRYIPDDFGGNVASVLAVNNGTSGTMVTKAVKIQDDQGFTLFYQHFWTAKLRSTVAIGYNHQNLASFLPVDTQNAPTTKTVHLNLIMRPVPSVDVGIEGMIGQKTFQKGTGVGPKNAERIELGGIWHF